jgi:hypothetical protein
MEHAISPATPNITARRNAWRSNLCASRIHRAFAHDVPLLDAKAAQRHFR